MKKPLTHDQIGAIGGKAGTGKAKRRGNRKHYATLQRKAAAKRHANAIAQNRDYVQTIFRIKPPKKLDMGGYIDRRTGRLRLADQMDLQPDGRWKITRRWRAGKWDRDIYPVK